MDGKFSYSQVVKCGLIQKFKTTVDENGKFNYYSADMRPVPPGWYDLDKSKHKVPIGWYQMGVEQKKVLYCPPQRVSRLEMKSSTQFYNAYTNTIYKKDPAYTNYITFNCVHDLLSSLGPKP